MGGVGSQARLPRGPDHGVGAAGAARIRKIHHGLAPGVGPGRIGPFQTEGGDQPDRLEGDVVDRLLIGTVDVDDPSGPPGDVGPPGVLGQDGDIEVLAPPGAR